MAADLKAEILAELGRGDEVAVAERLKAAAVALASGIDGLDEAVPEAGERLPQVLAATSDAAEAFLAVAFPVLEYGHEASLKALAPALRHVALATSAARTDQAATRVAATVALGRLAWALAAFALDCDRPEALAAANRAQVIVPFANGDVESVISLQTLRYPDALGGNAGNSFADYHEWLSRLPLLGEYPLFTAEFEVAFAEGDLVLAMLLGRLRGGVCARGRSRESAQRLAARVDDRAQRHGFEALFPGDGALEERLDAAYRATESDYRGFDRGPAALFEVEA
jgi:hypothetical protein